MAVAGRALVRTGRTASVLAGVVGVLSDLLQPVTALGWWAVGLCAAATLVAGGYWTLKEHPALRKQLADGRLDQDEYAAAKAQNRWLSATLGTLFALPLLIAVTFLTGRFPDKGFLAAKIPAVEQLQGSLLRIEHAVTQVAENTQVLTTQVAGIDAKMDAGFASLEEALARAGNNPITNPRTPQDFLLNAKIYASTGDYPKAKDSYRRFFSFDLEYIEPHLDYQALVKNTDGLVKAQQEYDMKVADGRAFTRYLRIMLDESTSRRFSALNTLWRTVPDFGPALAELMSMEPARLDPLGQQGGVAGYCALQRRWRQLLAALDTTMARGDYLRYYLDKRAAEERARLVARPLNGFRWLADTGAAARLGFDPCGMADSQRRGLSTLKPSAKEDSIANLILNPPR